MLLLPMRTSERDHRYLLPKQNEEVLIPDARCFNTHRVSLLRTNKKCASDDFHLNFSLDVGQSLGIVDYLLPLAEAGKSLSRRYASVTGGVGSMIITQSTTDNSVIYSCSPAPSAN